LWECRTELAESETSPQGEGGGQKCIMAGTVYLISDMYITEYQALCGSIVFRVQLPAA